MSIEWLLDRFSEFGERPALVWQDRPISFKQLRFAVENWQRVLGEMNPAPGPVVGIRADYSPQSCSLLLALMRGCIAVPLTEVVDAHQDEFLEVANAQTLFLVAPGDTHTVRTPNHELIHPMLGALVDSKEPGLILFSSGSTGKPKAILHNMLRFLSKFRNASRAMKTVAMSTFDHVAGLDTMFYCLSSGGTLIVPTSRDPKAVCEAIHNHRAELLPASATFLNLLLLSEAYRSFNLSSVQMVAYGSDVMPESTLARLRNIFPNTRFIQKYGMTEVGSPRTRSQGEGSLWFKIESTDGVEFRVKDDTLWVRSPTAMLGYLNAPSPFDEEGWLNTGDEVRVDGEFIRVLGRKSEIINVGGSKVYPAEVESALMQMDNVLDVVVRGEANALMGKVVAARVLLDKPEELPAFRTRMREFCREKLEPYKIPAKVEIMKGDEYSQRQKKIRTTSSTA